MARRITASFLSFCILFSLSMNIVTPIPSASAANGAEEVYIQTRDLSNASRYGGTGFAENFVDQYSGGNQVTDNYTLLLQQAGDYVEYDIDLADEATSAVLKVHSWNAGVWVIPEGGAPIEMTPYNGGLANRGVNLYALTEADGLASPDNRLTVRIEYVSGTVVLNSIYIQTQASEWTGKFTLNPLGESYMRSVYDVSASVTRYFANEKDVTLHVPNGSYVTFAFDYSDTFVDLAYQYVQLGAPFQVEASTDHAIWYPVADVDGLISDVLTLNADRKVYLRFSAQSGDAFLQGLTIDPVLPAITVDRYFYMPIQDLSRAARSQGASIVTSFQDLSIDGAASVENPTLLLQNAGDQVEFDFDLNDDATSAVLKLYLMGGEVAVKPKGGGFVPIVAANDEGGSFDRNVAIFNLTEADALQSADRQFTVRIASAGAAVVLQALEIEANKPEIADSYVLQPLGESYMKHVYSVSQGVNRYFANQTEPTLFLHGGQQVTFAFDYVDNVGSISYAFEVLGAPITAEVSYDLTDWETLPGTSGKVDDALPLNSARQFYVRFSALDGDSFLKSFTLTPFSPVGGVNLQSLYLPVKDLADVSRYGGEGLFEQFQDTYSGGGGTLDNPSLLLQIAGGYVDYDIDLSDEITAARLKLYTKDGAVSVKPRDGSFVPLTAVNEAGGSFDRNVAVYELSELDALQSASREFTVRIANAGVPVLVNGLLIETAQEELTGNYELLPFGESHLKQLHDVSQSATRYFYNGTEPTLHLQNGNQVTYAFDFSDTFASIRYSFEALGQPIQAEVSTDLATWTALSSTSGTIESKLPLNAQRSFYLRFTANQGDSFLWHLRLAPGQTPAGSGGFYIPPATSELKPVIGTDLREVYLPIHNLDHASRHGGPEIVESFNDTFADGSEELVNSSLLLQGLGGYVEYDFDLEDDISAARLKVYMKDGHVSVKADGDSNFQPLNALNEEGGSFNRNVAIYELTENDALKNASRTFTVRIENKTAPVVLNAIAIESELKLLSGPYVLKPWGESYLKQLYDVSQRVTRYFYNGTEPTLFVVNGSHVILRFAFDERIDSIRYAYANVGEPITAEASANNRDWVRLPGEAGLLEDVLPFEPGQAFYVRFSAMDGDSFLRSFNLTPATIIDTEPDSGTPSEFKRIGSANAQYVYLPIVDLSNASRSKGSQIVAGFNDSYIGGSEEVSNPVLLLQEAGDYVEYDLDLKDSITSARLKLHMKDGIVSVKPRDGKFVTLKALNEAGGSFDRNVAIYELSESDALQGSSNQFTVRIMNGGAAVVVNSLVVETAVPAISSEYSMLPYTESYMKHLYDVSQNVSRYFYNGTESTVFIKQGSHATLRFAYGSDVTELSYFYSNVGERLTAEASLDGTNWVMLEDTQGNLSGALAIREADQLYVRFSANEGDSFLRSFSLFPQTESGGENGAGAADKTPIDQRYLYFRVGTTEEQKYMFGIGGDRVAAFERTHHGMDYDAFEGGYKSALLPKNARVFHGQSITYAFDLHDSLDSAKLKLYGLAGMEVLVAPDGSNSFQALSTSYKPSGSSRGYYVFDLTEKDALAAANNKFRLMLRGSFGMLFDLSISSALPGPISSGVLLAGQTEAGSKYLLEARNVGTYYLQEAFPNLYVGGTNGADSYLLYRIDVADGVSDAVLYATFSGSLDIAVSNAYNGKYTTLIRSTIGGTGNPPTTAASLAPYLGGRKSLYVRVTGSELPGFLDQLGIAMTPREEKQGGFDVFTPQEAKYLYSINNDDAGYGMSYLEHDGATKLRSLGGNSEIVYKLDLADEGMNGIDIQFISTAGEFELQVSADGETYRTVIKHSQPGTYVVREQDAFIDNPANTLYIKVLNPSANEKLVYRSLRFSSEGVPPPREYPWPETGEFDYNDRPFAELAGLARLPEPIAFAERVLNQSLGNQPARSEKDGSKRDVAIWAASAAGILIAAAAGVYIRLRKGGRFSGKA